MQFQKFCFCRLLFVHGTWIHQPSETSTPRYSIETDLAFEKISLTFWLVSFIWLKFWPLLSASIVQYSGSKNMHFLTQSSNEMSFNLFCWRLCFIIFTLMVNHANSTWKTNRLIILPFFGPSKKIQISVTLLVKPETPNVVYPLPALWIQGNNNFVAWKFSTETFG